MPEVWDILHMLYFVISHFVLRDHFTNIYRTPTKKEREDAKQNQQQNQTKIIDHFKPAICTETSKLIKVNGIEVLEFTELKLPAKLIHAQVRGKQIALVFENETGLQHIIFNLGKGASFVPVQTKDLSYYPYRQCLNFLFMSSSTHLGILDTQQFSHMVHWEVREGSGIIWNPSRSPCIVTEQEDYFVYLNKFYDNNKSMCRKITVAAALLSQELANGVGAYGASECLFRYCSLTGLNLPILSALYSKVIRGTTL